MLFRPRYGRVGCLALPYLWLFELMAPVIERGGMATIALAACFGALSRQLLVEFLLFGYAFATVISIGSVLQEEITYKRYNDWQDVARLVTYCFLEHFPYRQMHMIWRLQGARFSLLLRQRYAPSVIAKRPQLWSIRRGSTAFSWIFRCPRWMVSNSLDEFGGPPGTSLRPSSSLPEKMRLKLWKRPLLRELRSSCRSLSIGKGSQTCSRSLAARCSKIVATLYGFHSRQPLRAALRTKPSREQVAILAREEFFSKWAVLYP